MPPDFKIPETRAVIFDNESEADFCAEPYHLSPVLVGMMDNPSTLRCKAAHFFERAASSPPAEAEKLNEVGQQLQLWADDLEEMLTCQSKDSEPSAPGKKAQSESIRS